MLVRAHLEQRVWSTLNSAPHKLQCLIGRHPRFGRALALPHAHPLNQDRTHFYSKRRAQLYIVNFRGGFSGCDRGGEIPKRNRLPRSERASQRHLPPKSAFLTPFSSCPLLSLALG